MSGAACIRGGTGFSLRIALGLALAGCGSEEPAATLPGALHAEEVSFPSTDLTLEGTLLVPAAPAGERLPAVVLGHGSGPIDRDETVAGQLGMGFGFEIAVFAELALALADAGYVVLRYDKRSCTRQTGCQNAYPARSSGTVDDYVVDVQAALDWLHTRAEVDPERVFYLGHSQGAQFAPELLDGRDDLRAAVMLAGPHSSVDELLKQQASLVLELALRLGLPTNVPELTALNQGVLELQQLRAGSFTGDSILGDTTAQWQAWMALGDRARTLAPALDRPLLALSGDYDFNVPPGETEAWRATFAASSTDPGHEALVLPCVSHALNCISEPDLLLLGEDDFGRHIDPAVPAEIVRFLALHGSAL